MYANGILSIPQNIRIMAKYYTRITMKRMAGLLDLSIDVSNTVTISPFVKLSLVVKKNQNIHH